MTARSKRCGHRTAMWYRIDGSLTEHRRSDEDVHLRCQSCGAIVPFGPSDDADPAVQIEIRAAELALDFPADDDSFDDIAEEVGRVSHELDDFAPSLDDEWPGWLARQIATHDAAHLETEADGGER